VKLDRRRRAEFVLIAWSIAPVVAGCGDGARGPVAHWYGRVTVKGQPLPEDAKGRIFFAPVFSQGEATAAPTSAEIVESEYDSTNVPVGQVNVRFEIKRPTGRNISGSGGDRYEQLEDLVPEKQRDGTLVTVEEGETRHDFDL
jgi:hypothetical protein